MGKGRSAPAPTEQTVVQSNLPKYVQPYFERLLQRAESESKRDYETYQGQRRADDTQELLDARQKVRDISEAGLPGLDSAMDAASSGIARAQKSFDFSPEMFTDAGVMERYMSPYMQNVVDVQKERARLDARKEDARRQAAAIKAGAFGGSRAALMQSAADEALARNLAEIQATGQQKAFEQAQAMFGQDRAAKEAAEKLGLSAAESATTQANQLANLQVAAQQGDIEAARLLEQVGKDIQAGKQADLDLAYEDFVRQRDFPKEQLTYLSSILRGVPVQPSTETTKFQQYNPIRDLLGTGIAGLGLYRGLTGG
jgi:hypothetical protein